jgi:protein-S-isoprenylcysteine O-methyltransferase Ste14
MTSSTPSTRSDTALRISYLIKGSIAQLLFLAIYLIAAGRGDWFWAWLYTFLFIGMNLATVLLVDPGLLVERATRPTDAKAWDRPYVLLAAALLPLLSGLVAGLDLRLGWRPEIPTAVQWMATIIVVIGFAIVVWAMWANAYFSAVVRIQTDRGHSVATGGPYRIVRHPGYVGAILFTIAMPVMLGSVWALIPAVLAGIIYVLRTRKEDDTLQAELPGYRDYMQQTRFRLIPGVW